MTSEGLIAFQFGARNTISEDFVARTNDFRIISEARTELLLPEKERNSHITGIIHRISSGENPPWSWQHEDSLWILTKISIELCDALPSYVENHLEEWLENVRYFCPWACYLKKEL